MNNLFGTDGIRGEANKYPITAEVALKLGMAIATKFRNNTCHNSVIVGKDTRLSGYMLESALQAGIISSGMNVILVGPMPSPAVAMLTTSLRATIGIVLTASHNRYQDNGIKIFNKNGFKIGLQDEIAITALLETGNFDYVNGSHLGRAKRLEDACGRYIEFAKNTSRYSDFSDMKIVIDCANGAAYSVAECIFSELNANVITINNKPDGYNINKNCGSEYTNDLRKTVIENNADIGIAFDGDADRLVVCDEKGKIITGEQVLASLVDSSRQESNNDVIVSTILASQSLENYLVSKGKVLIRTDVGDRNIVNAMLKHRSIIGGEPAGHFILMDHTTTADGIISALEIINALKLSDNKASDFFNNFEQMPSIKRNIYNVSLNDFRIPAIERSIKHVNDALKKLNGRMVIRQSGTENCMRIMIEGEDCKVIEDLMREICEVVNKVYDVEYT